MASTNFRYKNTSAPSKSKIEITKHGADRLAERLHITNEKAMRDHLYSVRYNKGIDIQKVNIYNFQSYGISQEVLHYIKRYPYYNDKGYKTFLYNNFIYFFTGKQSRRLITAVPIPVELTKKEDTNCVECVTCESIAQ